MAQAKLIVGLGNPGPKYEFTRHNFGFMVLKHLANEANVTFKHSSMFAADIVRAQFLSQDVYLACPTTFMNNSGESVGKIVRGHDIELLDILIVCDECHLSFGQIRLRAKGSEAGHNGLKSITQHLRTQEYARLRVGIGQPKFASDQSDFVLSSFSQEEKEHVPSVIESAANCCVAWLTEGLDAAMNKYNQRKENE